MHTIESAGISDIGKRRKDNEDALLVDDDMGLYVVADGMGGHRAGEIASRLVVESIHGHIRDCRAGTAGVKVDITDQTLSPAANQILTGIRLSNKVVHQAANKVDDYHGMGSTVAALYVNNGTLVAANVGDSPIFLIHKGQLETLSVMHTIKAERAAADPGGADLIGSEYDHVLTRAMGVEMEVDANICEVPYFAGDKLVISSDGLTDLVSPPEILASVTRHPPGPACQELVDMANERGGTDNVTVIVLQIRKPINSGGKIKRIILQVSEVLFNKYGRSSLKEG
jgi:protein phosphatase